MLRDAQNFQRSHVINQRLAVTPLPAKGRHSAVPAPPLCRPLSHSNHGLSLHVWITEDLAHISVSQSPSEQHKQEDTGYVRLPCSQCTSLNHTDAGCRPSSPSQLPLEALGSGIVSVSLESIFPSFLKGYFCWVQNSGLTRFPAWLYQPLVCTGSEEKSAVILGSRHEASSSPAFSSFNTTHLCLFCLVLHLLSFLNPV